MKKQDRIPKPRGFQSGVAKGIPRVKTGGSRQRTVYPVKTTSPNWSRRAKGCRRKRKMI